MKKAWWIGGAAVLIALAAAGVFFGPRLYSRLAGAHTPLGRITQVETRDSFGLAWPAVVTGRPGIATLMTIPLRSAASSVIREDEMVITGVEAETGFQLWVVRFEPMHGAAPDSDNTLRGWIDTAVLWDDIGQKYRPGAVQGQNKDEPASARALAFSLPRARRGDKLQFGDASPVRLPAPQGNKSP